MHPSFGIFFADDLGETQTRILRFCKDWQAGKDTFEFHTSGSTGGSKALIVNRFQLESSAKATAKALGLRAGDRALVALNTDFTAGKMMLVRGLVLGLKLFVVLPSSNPLKKLPEEKKWRNFYRRLAKDYEKIIESSVAMIQLAFISLILNNF